MSKSKLIYKNEWEYDSYFYKGQRIQDLTQVEIENKRSEVCKRKVEVFYDEMGHRRSSVSTHFFIKERVFGMEMEFDLNTIVDKVRIVPVLFSLKTDGI